MWEVNIFCYPRVIATQVRLPQGFNQTWQLSALRHQFVSQVLIAKDKKIWRYTQIWRDKAIAK